MFRAFVFAALASASLAAPGFAATVFADDFAKETLGTKLKLLENFHVAGNIDVVAHKNKFGITTPLGTVIDLDGTKGRGTITSKSTFAFKAGDVVTIGMLVGGSQRGNDPDDLKVGFTFASAVQVFDWTGTGYLDWVNIGSLGKTGGISAILYDLASISPFAQTSMSFRAGTSGKMKLFIGTDSADNIGPLLASVSLDITPTPVPLPAAGLVLLMGIGLLGALRVRRA